MILFVWVILKIWFLILGSRLNSCDHCYVMFFVPDHIELSCLICLQAISIKISKSFSIKICLYWCCFGTCRNFRPSVLTFDPGRNSLTSPDLTPSANWWNFFCGASELPTPNQNFRRLACLYIYPLNHFSNPSHSYRRRPPSSLPFSQRSSVLALGLFRVGDLWIPHWWKLHSPLFLLWFARENLKGIHSKLLVARSINVGGVSSIPLGNSFQVHPRTYV